MLDFVASCAVVVGVNYKAEMMQMSLTGPMAIISSDLSSYFISIYSEKLHKFLSWSLYLTLVYAELYFSMKDSEVITKSKMKFYNSYFTTV